MQTKFALALFASWLAFAQPRQACPAGDSNYDQLAICYLKSGDFPSAARAIEAALAARPGDATAIYLKSYLLFHVEHYAESEKLIRAYLSANPASIGARKLLGMDLYMLHNYDAALEELKRATELAPNDSESFYYLGRLYFSTDKAGAAAEAFQHAIKDDPVNAKAWNHLGQSYEALNRLADAEQAYRKSIEITQRTAGKYEWPYFNLGVLYSNNGRTREGIPYLREALARNPSWTECKVKLAAALFSTGDTTGALPLMNEAVQAEPANAEAHYRFAMMLRKAGRAAEAQRQFAVFEKLQQEPKK